MSASSSSPAAMARRTFTDTFRKYADGEGGDFTRSFVPRSCGALMRSRSGKGRASAAAS